MPAHIGDQWPAQIVLLTARETACGRKCSPVWVRASQLDPTFAKSFEMKGTIAMPWTLSIFPFRNFNVTQVSIQLMVGSEFSEHSIYVRLFWLLIIKPNQGNTISWPGSLQVKDLCDLFPFCLFVTIRALLIFEPLSSLLTICFSFLQVPNKIHLPITSSTFTSLFKTHLCHDA